MGESFEIINPDDDPRYRDYVATYAEVAGRKGVTPDAARTTVRTSTTAIAALAVRRGEADAMICGLEGRFRSKLRYISDIIGLAPNSHELASMALLITERGVLFLTDSHVQADPTPQELARTIIQCVHHIQRFGIVPKVALVCHSDFGDYDTPSSVKMRNAVPIIRQQLPNLEIDGEMQVDTALLEPLRDR